MSRVKIRNNRLTLPEEARQKLGVSEGDYLDVEVAENGVLPKPLADRERAWERVFEAYRAPGLRSEPASADQRLGGERRLLRDRTPVQQSGREGGKGMMPA